MIPFLFSHFTTKDSTENSKFLSKLIANNYWCMQRLPIDIILVRHGESEGNIAQNLSKLGDDALWTKELQERHNSNYRLTDKGREQARVTGNWIKQNISENFDRYYCSEYIRAQETSALMNFKESVWYVEGLLLEEKLFSLISIKKRFSEFYLREQDRGILAGKSKIQREREFSDLVERLSKDAFYLAVCNF